MTARMENPGREGHLGGIYNQNAPQAIVRYLVANSLCISSKVNPLVSGYTNKTTKNCRTIITAKKTNG